ncbi:hypothetical protein KI688_006016 [Linnemannia hyalina]|uniref:Uncharacterized protein n=1 Tax=Linnemannia hyalina TaxID=64524 RepID=A0A9P8BXC4_9FUNG|nr:hypothetical protein KI688_006016 [Linnemannia hyalina]
MEVNYKSYCDNTNGEHISLEGFMRRFSFVNDKHRILGLWTGGVVPYLLSHTIKDRRDIGKCFSKIGRTDLEIIIDRELQIREHSRVMLPQVAKQQQALGELNTALTKEFAASEVRSIESELETETHTDCGSATRSEARSAGKSKRSARTRENIGEGQESATVDKLEQQDDSMNEKRKKKSRVGAPSSSMSTSTASSKPTHDRGRSSSLSTGGDDFVCKPYVDVSSLKVHKYQIGNCNVGQLFKKFQENSSTIVNDFDITVSLSNISQFLYVHD